MDGIKCLAQCSLGGQQRTGEDGGELIEASNYTEAAHDEDTGAGVSLHQAQSPSSLQRGVHSVSIQWKYVKSDNKIWMV